MEKVLVFFAKHDIAKVPVLASLNQTDLESAEGWPTDLETKSLLRRRHQMAANASAVKAQHPSVTDLNCCPRSRAAQPREPRATRSLPKRSWRDCSARSQTSKGEPGGHLPFAQTRSFFVRGVRGGKACRKGGSSSSPAVPAKKGLARLDDARHDRWKIPPSRRCRFGKRFCSIKRSLCTATSDCCFAVLPSIEQWTSVHSRYLVAVVACENLTIQQAMAYLAVINQFAE